MEVAVGLRREPGDDAFGPAGVEVGLHDIADEISPRLRDLGLVQCHVVHQPLCIPHLPEWHRVRPICQIRARASSGCTRTMAAKKPGELTPYGAILTVRSPATHLSRARGSCWQRLKRRAVRARQIDYVRRLFINRILSPQK